MKLGSEVLLEIMSIVQRGLIGQTDVSQDLRDLDLAEVDGELVLSNSLDLPVQE